MSDYRKLSLIEKQAASRAHMREAAVRCPSCDTATSPADLLAHVTERCQGPQEPGPTSQWIGWREAVRMGATKQSLSYWARSGHVRHRGVIQDRKYLLRDVAIRVAAIKRRRR